MTLIYQYHNSVLGVMNSFEYEKMIEKTEDDLYIVETIITNQIPILSFATIFDANYLHCYAGTIGDFIEYCREHKIYLKDASKTHRGMYVPFSNGYEKYSTSNHSNIHTKLRLLEMNLLPTREKFEDLGLTKLWYNYQKKQSLEMGAS